MKITVFGAGAVGGYLAGQLMASGAHEVSIVARGAHLAAIRAQGLTVESGRQRRTARPLAATDTPHELPPQDLVFVTLKACAQADAAAAIAALTGPRGWTVFVSNGVPWWWRYGTPQAGPLPLVDPGARLWNAVRPERVLGCVVYSANEIVEPGVVRHSGNNRWILGEPDGRLSERLQATVSLLASAALHAEACADLRREVWLKVARNLPLNAVCALTRLPIDVLGDVPGLGDLCRRLAGEVVDIARACGADIGEATARIGAALENGGATAGTQRWAGVRPSMLQDVLSGRALEVEAIVGQVHLLGRQAAVPCPAITTILALLRGLASTSSSSTVCAAEP